MKWKTRQADVESVTKLQEKYNIGLIAAKILAGRGITEPDQVKFYLENDISFAHNPFCFEDMEFFCERLSQAVEGKEKIRVFGDRDVDGITSTALLVTELRNLGLEVSFTVPMGDDPYGVTKDNIDKAIEDNIDLIITVDCGISCFEEIDYAQSNGIDVIVTDHHIPGDVLPPARAIINPKIEGCGYPFRDLAGCGVVAKCIWALRFSQTEFYNEPVMLLHAMPGTDTVIIEAARLENLMVTDRVCEEIVPGVLPPESSRLLKFLSCGLPVFVFDAEAELIQMKKAFPKADINLTDLRPQFEKYIPAVKGKSLFALNNISRFALYSEVRSELDTLIGLWSAFVRSSCPELYKKYENIMDLVAIGTISDLMPMVNENRIMVKTGLRMLEKSSRLSLIPFLSLQNLLGKKLGTTDISWQISPAMNASGRLGKPDICINMLLSEDQHEAFEYAQELVELNKERQKLGEQHWDRLLPTAKKSFESFGSKFVLLNDNKIPRGITGIISTRLQKTFKVPAFVITQTNDGRAVGSIRSTKGFNCHDFLSKYADLFDDYGGHDCAGGCTLSPEKTDELAARISEDIDYMDCPEDEDEDFITIDSFIPQELFSQNLLSIVERFEPYGEQNPPIHFSIEGVRIENMIAMANSKDASSNHLRMTLSFANGFKWPCVFWAAGNRVGKDFNEGDIVDAVFRMGRNYYHNQESIQLTVEDITRH